MCCGSTDENRLLSSLFDQNSYSRHVRPVVDHRKPVVVDVRLSLVEIVGLDETNGRLTMKLQLNLVHTMKFIGHAGQHTRVNNKKDLPALTNITCAFRRLKY